MKLETDINHDQANVRAALARIATGRRAAVEVIAARLKVLIDEAFVDKSQGQTGSDGITWRARKDGKLPIGIKTGYLRSTLKVEVESRQHTDTVSAYYAHPFATAFGAIRPLIPAQMPPFWRRELTRPADELARQASAEFTR